MANQSPLDGLISTNEDMLKICRTIEKIAPTNASTLLMGESGTGKEILARALHALSSRAAKRFVAINCAAIPENLLESELFGHEKGAFTGADKTTIGKIEMADGGTLFLDEIGDLPLALQAKLLRFLQERVVERVGGRKEIPVDVRIISATHRNIDAMISSGEFRQDLFYRLSEIVINIPPLRQRTGDAVILARHFVAKYAGQNNRNIKGLSQDAIVAIQNYAWPGNVRELENKIKRAVIMSESPQITADELDINFAENVERLFNLRQVREKAEHDAIVQALNVSGNNIAKASDLLGVSRPTLYDLMKKLKMKT